MKTTVTKKATQEFVKQQLGKNEFWAKNALLKIFDFQTNEEKCIEDTRFINGVGFTGADGEILTSFAKQLINKKYLSPKQMMLVFKKMPKYWNQIISISDQTKLEALVANSLNS